MSHELHVVTVANSTFSFLFFPPFMEGGGGSSHINVSIFLVSIIWLRVPNMFLWA